MNIKKRLNWALKNINNTQDEWNQIIWSYESKFMLHQDGGSKKIWMCMMIDFQKANIEKLKNLEVAE